MGRHGSGSLADEGDWLTSRPRAVLLGALAVFAIAGAIVAAGGGSSHTATSSNAHGPARPNVKVTLVSAQGLTRKLLTLVTTTIKHPVFWAGPRSGDIYELRRTPDGSVYLRYLPPGIRVGDPRATFLLIATYPYPDALQRLKQVANGGGTPVPGGGFALQVPARPTNYHLAYPRIPYEIEVYDPSPTTAKRVAESGDIRPVR